MLEAGEINGATVGTAFRELKAGDIETRGETSTGDECHRGIDRACAIVIGGGQWRARERTAQQSERIRAVVQLHSGNGSTGEQDQAVVASHC